MDIGRQRQQGQPQPTAPIRRHCPAACVSHGQIRHQGHQKTYVPASGSVMVRVDAGCTMISGMRGL